MATDAEPSGGGIVLVDDLDMRHESLDADEI